jgi:hypothetical protein
MEFLVPFKNKTPLILTISHALQEQKVQLQLLGIILVSMDLEGDFSIPPTI